MPYLYLAYGTLFENMSYFLFLFTSAVDPQVKDLMNEIAAVERCGNTVKHYWMASKVSTIENQIHCRGVLSRCSSNGVSMVQKSMHMEPHYSHSKKISYWRKCFG